MTHPATDATRHEAVDATVTTASSYILVVDDESVVRSFLARCLEEWGYSVKTVATAAEALETMVASPAAAVLCDIRMPGHDGLWLASRLRAHWPNTPVIMATGLDDLDTVRQSRELGAVDYLTKPITADKLQPVVERVLASAGHAEATLSIPDELPDVAGDPAAPRRQSAAERVDAEYTLESAVKCPACGERVTTLRAVRLIRAHVNFTSTLPRRGRVVACPHCLAIVPAELTNF